MSERKKMKIKGEKCQQRCWKWTEFIVIIMVKWEEAKKQMRQWTTLGWGGKKMETLKSISKVQNWNNILFYSVSLWSLHHYQNMNIDIYIQGVIEKFIQTEREKKCNSLH